jgi:serine phosphatase RsbU (regulator of sigma subunit)
VNLKERSIIFSAAHHKLYVIKENGTDEVYNGDRHHIGSEFEEGFQFQERKILLDAGDQVYMFSDGIYDQKGGKDGKKLYLKRTKDLLHSVQGLSMDSQNVAISNFMKEWIGNNIQLDDMVLFSIKF